MAATATATRGRKPGQGVDPNETSSQRFRRLAEGRMNKGLNGIRGVAQLANPNRYEYTDEDVDKIEATLRSEVESTVRALRDRKLPSAQGFHL